VNCARFETLIALDVESDLPEPEARLVAEHLEACGSCREFEAAMRQSQAALKTLRLDDVDDSVYAQVRTEVLSEIASERKTMAWLKYAIAAALLVALAVGWLWRTRPNATAAPHVTAAVQLPLPPVVSVQAAPIHKRPVRVTRRKRRQPEPKPVFKSEPLLVKMLTDDPQVVIYWLVDQNGG
jgi:anti-sigma factor RsiW